MQASEHVERFSLQSRSQSALSLHASEQNAPSPQVSLQSLEPPQSSLHGPVVHVNRHLSFSLHEQLGPHSPVVVELAPVSAPLSEETLPEVPEELALPDDPDDELLAPSAVDPVPMFQS